MNVHRISSSPPTIGPHQKSRYHPLRTDMENVNQKGNAASKYPVCAFGSVNYGDEGDSEVFVAYARKRLRHPLPREVTN